MGRFKAGDRVTILAGHPYYGANDVIGLEMDGTVQITDGKARGYRGNYGVDVVGRTGELYFKGRELELLDAPSAQEQGAETWVPKVGDRVVFVRDNPNGGVIFGKAGQEVSVTEILDYEDGQGHGKQVRISNTGCGFDPAAPLCVLGPAPLPVAEQPAGESGEVAPAWAPKVGDRVRYSGKSTQYRDAYMVGALGTVRTVRVYGVDVRWNDEYFGGGRTGGDKYVENLEPIAPATTWAPVAGKFGKTRDGRKAGPLKDRGEWFAGDIHEGEGGKVWRRDGKHGSPHGIRNIPTDDLIAEWVEPAPVVVAEASATPVPIRKFKVGDIVNYIDGKKQNIWQKVSITKDTGYSYHAFCPKTGEGAFQESWIELAPPAVAPGPAPTDSFIVARLTAKGEPRPNARPRVHLTLDEANAEAQRLANRLGDEFAVFQRVSSRTVDAGPVPRKWTEPMSLAEAKEWLRTGDANAGNNGMAFSWDAAPQGFEFWAKQAEDGLNHLGRSILRNWITEAEASAQATKEAA